jgi:hypothetical protein
LKGGEAKDEAETTGQAGKDEQSESKGKAEKFEAGESGDSEGSGNSKGLSENQATIGDLPEVPAAEPSTGEEPASKRQKSSSDS